ncbi:rhodanese-like domain-containing protein [uncultured Hoeflea sp.]|uniref:rhodanese-like domain-containing protein n=1 Tax=uncultured Hoeflea sp. TaxID=538666 RepID=UPI00262702B8|nr:rhodanese-like domain-containing protein [uncultured Hoeflea sp.]
MNTPIRLSIIAAIAAGALIAGAGADAAMAEENPLFAPSPNYLERAHTTLTGLRNMTPKWGIQPVEAFKTTMDAGVPIVMIDVREPAEWAEGVIDGAMLLNLNEIPTEEGLAKLPADRMTAIGVYCKSGHRSGLALSVLHQLGYANAINMAGGFEAWKKAEYPTVKPAE